MKKILMGSTAALAVAILAAPAAALPEVKLTGNVLFQAGASDGGDGLADFITKGDFQFDMVETLESGLIYGGKLDMDFDGVKNGEGAFGDVIMDEAMVFLSGSFGRIELGDEDGAADTMKIYTPTVGIGQVDGDAGSYSSIIGGVNRVSPDDSADSTKVTYYTPRFAGFQAGASYAPFKDDFGSVSETQAQEDFIEVGLNYDSGAHQDFWGEFGFQASLTYASFEKNSDRVDGYQLGSAITYKSFGFGVGWVNQEVNADDQEESFIIGGTYTFGPWAVGISYAYNDLSGGADHDSFGIGASYQIASGLSLAADLVYEDIDIDDPAKAPVAADDEALTGLAQLQVRF